MEELKLQTVLVVLGIIAAILSIVKNLLEITDKILSKTNAKSSPNPHADESKTE